MQRGLPMLKEAGDGGGFQDAFRRLESTRVMLRDKRKIEGRPYHLHDLLEGCGGTVVGGLLTDAILGGKDPIDTIYTYFAAIRYHSGEDPLSWDQTRLVDYTRNNYQQLLATTKERHLAKNVGQRALPVLALLAEAKVSEPLAVIELGASAGMIGRALINHRKFLQSLQQLCVFSPKFQDFIAQHPIYQHSPDIRTYLGLDMEISDERWVLACIEEPEGRRLAETFMTDFSATPEVALFETNALGFSSLPQIRKLKETAGLRPAVLTSMMMYQLPHDIKYQLTTEIEQYLRECNGLWVLMDFDSTKKRFTGDLRGYGSGKEKIGPIIFANGDCMEWTHEQ